MRRGREGMMIETRLLDVIEAGYIYERYMVTHFPPNEMKSFRLMEQAMEQGVYFPYGYYENDRLIGYAFVMKNGNTLLLDYFAVLEQYRREGYGSIILKQLEGSLGEEETLLIELEQPDHEEPEIRQLQFRRIAFYVRNGAKGAGATEMLTGCTYRLFTLGKPLYGEKAVEAMRRLYGALLSKEMLETLDFLIDVEMIKKEREE